MVLLCSSSSSGFAFISTAVAHYGFAFLRTYVQNRWRFVFFLLHFVQSGAGPEQIS
jgi:hypothetical protein